LPVIIFFKMDFPGKRCENHDSKQCYQPALLTRNVLYWIKIKISPTYSEFWQVLPLIEHATVSSTFNSPLTENWEDFFFLYTVPA
jgi:hypothetical protein